MTVNEEIVDYAGKRISAGDSSLNGRVIFQMMENYWPATGDKITTTRKRLHIRCGIKKVHKVILSKTLKEAYFSNTEIVGKNVSESKKAIKQNPGKDILLFDSPTATHLFNQKNLIGGYDLFVNPVFLGKGIPLFVGVK